MTRDRKTDVNLPKLARELETHFAYVPPTGYERGREALCIAITRLRGCPKTTADALVDLMETHGFLRYKGELAEAGEDERAWRILPQPL